MLEHLDQWIAGVGWLGYLVLGLAAMIEYIFPPFPGDTIMLLGGVYAVRGQKPWFLVLLVLTVGSMAGAMVDYWIGTRLYFWIERRPPNKRFLGLTHEQVLHAEARMRKRGPLLILVNRFLPGIRGIIYFAAGAAEMPARQVLILGTLSATAFNLLILGIGIAVGGSAERLEGALRTYQQAVYLVLGALGLLLLLRFLWGRRKTSAAAKRIE